MGVKSTTTKYIGRPNNVSSTVCRAVTRVRAARGGRTNWIRTQHQRPHS